MIAMILVPIQYILETTINKIHALIFSSLKKQGLTCICKYNSRALMTSNFSTLQNVFMLTEELSQATYMSSSFERSDLDVNYAPSVRCVGLIHQIM